MAAEVLPRLRTAPELATLLLELGRLIRARRFYAPGDSRLAAVFERSLRAWRSDLGRRGVLDLELVSEGFREGGGRGVLAHPQLTELQQDLAERGVRQLRFEAALDGDAFAAFAEVLATDAGRTASRGGFASALYARTPFGIQVNGVSPGVARPPAAPELEEAEVLSIASALSSTDDTSEASPSLDIDGLLRQLDVCTSAGRYLDLGRRVTLLAERAFDEGGSDACFRVSSRLAAHAHAKTSARLRELAKSFLRSLAQGARLRDVLARALRAGDEADREADQVLLALGELAAAALLDAAAALEGGKERERLVALLVALADHALPVVAERLRPDDPPPRARAAARIAGELQHADLVPPLASLLSASDRGVREEAARALARMGSDAAVDALARALGSEAPGLAGIALHGLAGSGSPRAVPPLHQALEAAIEARDLTRAKELIRALGRLGRPEAADGLVGVLERRVRLGGGWLRELKSAAVAALAAVPGDDAVAALAQAAQARDTQLRRAAQNALDRRAQARARAGS